MKVLDPGHRYAARHLDGPDEEIVTFVKREGENYPGNEGHHAGTNLQELCRIMIDRAHYLNRQNPCLETQEFIRLQRDSIRTLEIRAARMHDRPVPLSLRLQYDIENLPVCDFCGHVGCAGKCQEKENR